MIRSWTLAAIGLAALSSIGAKAADPLPTETFKILPAALAVEASAGDDVIDRAAAEEPLA